MISIPSLFSCIMFTTQLLSKITDHFNLPKFSSPESENFGFSTNYSEVSQTELTSRSSYLDAAGNSDDYLIKMKFL